MKKLYLSSLFILLLFTFCDKKETEAPKPVDIEKQLIGSWKEVETTVKEYDINNNLLHTTPNISPVRVVFDGKVVTNTYAETFIEEFKSPYTVTQVGAKHQIHFEVGSQVAEITEISADRLTLVVKRMGSEFNGARFHYMLYTRKLVKL